MINSLSVAGLGRLLGYGFGRGLHQFSVPRRIEDELVKREVTQRQYQYRDNEVVELPAGSMGNGLGAIDILFFL